MLARFLDDGKLQSTTNVTEIRAALAAGKRPDGPSEEEQQRDEVERLHGRELPTTVLSGPCW